MKQFPHQINSHLRLFYLLLVILFTSVDVQQAQAQEGDDALKRRFLQEAPSQWEKYLQRIREVQGKFVLHTISDFRNMTVHEEGEYKASANGKLLKYVQHRNDDESNKQDFEEIYGVNLKYAFKLERKTPGSPWLLIHLIDFGLGENIPDKFTYMFKMFDRTITPLVKLESDLLADAVRQPTFRVVLIRTIHRNGEELVEVHFEYPHEPNNKPPYNSEQSGTILLDPKRFWILRASDLRGKDRTIKKNAAIHDLTNSFCVPQKMDVEEDVDYNAEKIARGFPAKIRKKIHADFTLEVPQRLPDDNEFTLSAFGLPEPSLAKRPFPWYLLVVAIGTVCLGAFFFLRARARRLRAGS